MKWVKVTSNIKPSRSYKFWSIEDRPPKSLQTENNIGICICDHQARDLLSCVDLAIVLSNCKIIAQGTPKELVNNIEARNAYFGDTFKIN